MKTIDYVGRAVQVAALLSLLTCTDGCLRAETPKDRFKALFSAPPIVERMIVTERLPKDPIHAVPLDTGLADSTNSVTYELRWQSNAMFLRTLARPSDSTNYVMGSPCFTLWDDHFYFLDNTKAAVLYVLEEENAAQGTYSGAYHATMIRRGKGTQILNLGVNHLNPGMIKWDGDGFLATGIADRRPIQIQGQITGYTNDIPSEMQVDYFNETGLARYRILYEYHSYRPPYYPARIRINLLYKNREVEYASYAIDSVSIAAKPLPRSHFDPAPFIEANRLQVQYFTNGNVYSKLPSGGLIETFGAAPKIKLSARDYRSNGYYYLAVGAATSLFLVLAINQKKKGIPRNAGVNL
ncbi:MAG: hypothetical protein L0Z50_34800 [Verrucomicrobiales bacterium]|nr:hypothetical protein [Verrucomicrobiales bacterium]